MGQNAPFTALKDKVLERIKQKEPSHFDVVMLNDDFTTKDFVVAVLISVFGKTIKNAVSIMESVHTTGKGIVGTYSYDIAVTLSDMVKNIAEDNGFPLRCIVQHHV